MTQGNSTLAGTIALVTGGGTGIGRASAAALTAAGVQAVITGRREDVLRDAAASMEGVHPVRYRAADMADPAQVAELVAWVEREVGPIAVLVNNAGVNIRERSLNELTLDNWDYVMRVNASGAFSVVHAVLPAMRERGQGLIVNVSSMAGVRGSSVSGAAYSASKHAVNAMTEVINEEEGGRGIRATSICPGAVNTSILDERPVGVSEKRRKQILQPEDVAAAVMFVVNLPPRALVPILHIVPAF